jgi:hypothetical protein
MHNDTYLTPGGDMTEAETLRRENERLRRELAQATKGQVVPGSGRKVEPRHLDTVLSVRLDDATLAALTELAAAHGTNRGEVVREGIRRLANEHRRGPKTRGAWGLLHLRATDA